MRKHSAKPVGKQQWYNASSVKPAANAALNAITFNKVVAVNPSEIDFYGKGESQDPGGKAKDMFADHSLHTTVKAK